MMTGFAQHLTKVNLFPKDNFEQIETLRGLFRDGQLTYREMGEKIPKLMAGSFQGLSSDDVSREARTYASQIINRSLFSYTKPLVKLMQSYGLTIALSGASREVVRWIGLQFKFDLAYGTELEIKHNTYTGKLKHNLILSEGKESAFKTIIQQHHINLAESFGFGDTDQDISFLSKVGNPIAVNPNQQLQTIAQQQGWLIINHDEDVISKIRDKLKR